MRVHHFITNGNNVWNYMLCKCVRYSFYSVFSRRYFVRRARDDCICSNWRRQNDQLRSLLCFFIGFALFGWEVLRLWGKRQTCRWLQQFIMKFLYKRVQVIFSELNWLFSLNYKVSKLLLLLFSLVSRTIYFRISYALYKAIIK